MLQKLIGLTMALLFLVAGQMHAQWMLLTWSTDTAYTSATLPGMPDPAKIMLYNTGTLPLEIEWQRTESFPSPGWSSAFTDGALVFAPTTDGYDFILDAGDSADTRVYFFPDSVPGTGIVDIRFRDKNNPADSVVLTYIANMMPAVGVEEDSELGITLWPNPSAGTVKVRLAKGGESKLELFSSRGERIRVLEFEGKEATLRDLPRGAFILRLTQGEKQAVRTIWVQ